jgi:Glycosyltransferase family 87
MEPQNKQRASLSIRNILLIAGIASLLLIYPLLYLRVINDPAQRTAADFLPFYAAGRIAITQGMSRVYDLEAQREAENDILNETIRQVLISKGQPVNPQDLGAPIQMSEVNPFPHPPFIVPALMLLARLDYVPAFVIWSIMMSLLFIVCAIILLRLVPQARGPDRWILFMGTFLFFPAFYSVLNGQDTALLLLGASMWLYGLLQEQDGLSGLGLALTLIRPHMGVMLALPFLFRRRRIWWWFCAAAGVLVLVSVLLLGWTGIVAFLHILITSANGEGNKFFNENLMVNLIGLLLRTFPFLATGFVRLVGWIGFGVAIIYLCVVWGKNGKITEKHIGLAVIITIIGVPHIHYHDLALLLIPIYAVMRVMLEKKLLKPGEAVLLPLCASLLLFISYFLLPALKYFIPYLLEIILLAALWFPERVIFWERKNKQIPMPV